MIDERTRRLVQQSSRQIQATHIEPTDDISNERQRASIDVQKLAVFLNGGQKQQDKKQRLLDLLQDKPWADKSRRYFWSREEEYVNCLDASINLWKMVESRELSRSDGVMARKLVNLPGGLELHFGMYIPHLLSQATQEQQAEWLPKAMELKHIGTYAQTELGHGTFLRGLETTATYDPETDEFIAHSPTLTATKWWPGGLGKTATHIILMARMFIKGKDYGPHSFIVQIRDLKSHKPLPGVIVGDIGPKSGYNGVDNGFLQFDHYRFPRKDMLMKYAKVSSKGEYSPPPASNAKASYSTMVYVRATIVEDAGWHLARATTIATRYTAVRRQTSSKPGAPELQVLDYQNVSNIVLPLVAASYALIFMGKAGGKMYHDFESDSSKGDFSLLPELHSVLSGMKALSTWLASDGCESCRRACGGHGFSMLSGLPSLFSSYVQNVTWEGDNNVLCLQTARFLVKQLVSAQEGNKIVGTSAYLADSQKLARQKCSVSNSSQWLNIDEQISAFRQRAASLVVEATKTLLKAGNGKLEFSGHPWNSNTVALIRATKAHLQLVLLQTFARSVKDLEHQDSVPSGTVRVLKKLVALFGLEQMLENAGDFLESGTLKPEQAGLAREAHHRLLRELRPEAVALVDSFDIPDYLLDSALGKYDGDVYRDLLNRAQLSPLNKTQEGPAWNGVLGKVFSQSPQSRL